MIYVYGVTERQRELPAVAGLGGASLEGVPAGALTAVCSSHDQLELRPDAGAAWAHDQVVEALMEAGPVLPARFGTTFDDSASLARAVATSADSLHGTLRRVKGCVELAVCVVVSEQTKPEPASDGQTYLREMLDRRRAATGLVDGPLAALAEIAVGSRISDRRGRGTVSIGYLVRRRDVERFCAAARQVQADQPELALSCTGPWAPYSFSSEEAVL
jgi:hypothetical protein